eukprot:321774-Hanusia_phi.AAC.1
MACCARISTMRRSRSRRQDQLKQGRQQGGRSKRLDGWDGAARLGEERTEKAAEEEAAEMEMRQERERVRGSSKFHLIPWLGACMSHRT